jgi:hypothetical protein
VGIAVTCVGAHLPGGVGDQQRSNNHEGERHPSQTLGDTIIFWKSKRKEQQAIQVALCSR